MGIYPNLNGHTQRELRNRYMSFWGGVSDYGPFSKIFVYLGLPRYLSLEKAMVPHSSTLAWKIPWTEEPGRLQSLGSLRV